MSSGDQIEPSVLRVWWRRLWCCNVDVIWGHLCQDGEGCYRPVVRVIRPETQRSPASTDGSHG